MRVTSREATPGWQFELALAVLQQLADARRSAEHGLSLVALGEQLRIDPLQLEPLVELLAEIDWISRLDEGDAARHVLLCDPATTAITPLLNRTLLAPGIASAAFRVHAGLDRQTLAQALAC